MKYILKTLAILCGAAALAASCQEAELLGGSGIAVDQADVLKFGIEDEKEAVFNVTAEGAWIATAPSWIRLSQYSGAGNAEIKVTVLPNIAVSKVIACDVEKYQKKGEPEVLDTSAAKLEENKTLADSMYVSLTHISFPRSEKITFFQGESDAQVTVQQEGDANCPSPIIDISIKDFLTLSPADVNTYRLKGTVTGIYNTLYGNFYLTDDAGTQVLVYGLLTADLEAKKFETLGITEGDYLVCYGRVSEYNGAIQIKNAVYESHEKSKIVAVDTDSKEMPVEGGVFDVLVNYSGDWFKFDIDADWISVVDQVITAEGMKLTFKVEENDAKNRTGVITYTSGKGELPGEGGEEEGEEGEESEAEAGESLSVTTTVSQIGIAADYFRKVSAVTSGKKYLIVAEDVHALSFASDKGFGYIGSSAVEYVDEDIKQANTDNAFIIESVEGGYTIRQAVDGRYLYGKGTYDNFNLSATLPAEGGVFTISADADGVFTITNTFVKKIMQYGDGTYTTFGMYSDLRDTASLPYLYELVEE